MQKTMQSLITHFQQMYQAKHELEEVTATDIPVDRSVKNDGELYTGNVQVLMRKLKMKKLIDAIKTCSHAIEHELQNLRQINSKMWDDVLLSEMNVVNDTNRLIEELKVITNRMAIKEKERNPEKVVEIQGICDDRFEELEGMRMMKEPLRLKHDDMRRTLVRESLCELCEMEIKEMLFHSDIHRWSVNNSEFVEKVKGHRHVCVVIEDNNNNIFGGYVSKEIVINEWIIDQTAFVFSMKKDGKYHPKKYPIMEGGNGLFVFPEFRNGLFIFGGGNADDNSPKDISVVKKSDDCDRCFSIQQSFNYGKDKKALTGNDQFFVSRIIVYELN